MASKDLTLDLIEKLDLMKKNKVDYLVVAMDPGKNVDRADIWYELANKDSPRNLLEACLNLFTNLYDKDTLIDVLLTYCEELDNAAGIEKETDISDILKEISTPPKSKKKKSPPNDTDNSEE